MVIFFALLGIGLAIGCWFDRHNYRSNSTRALLAEYIAERLPRELH